MTDYRQVLLGATATFALVAALATAFVIGREYPGDATCLAAVIKMARPVTELGEAIDERWRKLNRELGGEVPEQPAAPSPKPR